MLFQYPKQALFNKIIPKSKIYEHAKPSNKLKDKFVSQISQIIWKFKLAPETINLPSRASRDFTGWCIDEIQVFSITTKIETLSEEILRCIDRSIPSPIIFEVQYGDKIRVISAYKRQNEADPNRWVVDIYFYSEWLNANTNRASLPVALDLAGLYESIMQSLITIPKRDGESLRELVERAGVVRTKKEERKKLERKLSLEKQFNRKVEINSKIKDITKELDSLLLGDIKQ